MKPRYFIKVGVLLLLVFYCSAFQLTSAQNTRSKPKQATTGKKSSRGVSYDKLISQADDNIRKGQYAQALIAAQQGIKQNDQDYRGYYYAAFAFLKQELFDDAQLMAEKSRMHASDETRGEVDRLLKAIADGRIGVEQLQIAERAAADGVPTKAAEAFEKAYNAMPSRDDIGLRTARIYLQLKQQVRARQILDKIVARTQNPDTNRLASELLDRVETLEREQELQRRDQEAQNARQREEDNRRREEDSRRREEASRRDAEERKRLESERRKQEAERSRADRVNTLKEEKRKLEYARIDTETNMESEELSAESDDERAERHEKSASEAERSGGVSDFSRSAAEKCRRSAEEHRQKARRLRNQLNEINQKIEKIDQEINQLNNAR